MAKKGFIIGAGGLVLALLLLAPWLVGHLLERWADEQFGVLSPPVEYQLTRHWRHSRLELRLPDGSVLLAHARHVPLQPPGLATFEGAFLPAGQPAPVEFSGRLGWRGRLSLAAAMNGLEWTGGNWSVAGDGLRVTIDSAAALELTATAAALELAADDDRHLQLESPRLRLSWETAAGRGALSAWLRAGQPGRPASEAELHLAPVALEPLSRLLEVALAWNRYRDDRINRDLALLTVASAWQAMVQDGLELSVPGLNLEQAFRLDGRWRFDHAGGDNRVYGHGSRATLRVWAVPLIALAADRRPGEAEALFEQALALLAEHGWLVGDGDAITVSPPR